MVIDYTTAADTKSVKMNAEQTLQVRGDLIETIVIEIPDGAGGWNTLYEGGSQVVLDSTHLQLTSYGNTLVRLVKGVTASAVGVTIVG